MRLDLKVSEISWYSRNKARQLIEEGYISVDGKIITKPSHETTETEKITIREEKRIHWVSRSAGKLDGFLQELRIMDKEFPILWGNCLDVGSSTWGFTQVLLEHGASHVDAVDVGRDQLDPSLGKDSRVMSYEEMDIRDFSSETPYDIIVCDASFISLTEIFSSILAFADKKSELFLLWKPQFEVGREHLRKTWVPKNEKIIAKRQQEWEDFIVAKNCKIFYKSLSTVVGEAGNQEWMYWIRKW